MARRQLELHHLGWSERHRYDCGEDLAGDELACAFWSDDPGVVRALRTGLHNRSAGVADVCRLDDLGVVRYRDPVYLFFV